MPRFVALLRGVNVGKNNRVPMAELRALLEARGCTDVHTVLNSGNAVFSSSARSASTHADEISTALQERLGVNVPVVVVSAKDFDAIVAEAPLLPPNADPSRVLVSFVTEPATLAALRAWVALAKAPEQFVVGERAAYLYCPAGVLASKVGSALVGKAGRAATSRNWATVLKLAGLLQAEPT